MFLISALAVVFVNGYAASNHCTVSDFNGEWVGFQANVVTIPGTNPHTGACMFTVSNGEITDGTCEQRILVNPGPPPVLISPTGHLDGTVEVDPDCSATLTFDFSPYGRDTQSTYQVQLAVDKNTYAGRWENSSGLLGPTNGVKKPKSNRNFDD
jgi:hypothetical protein